MPRFIILSAASVSRAQPRWRYLRDASTGGENLTSLSYLIIKERPHLHIYFIYDSHQVF